jgi:hypothetical protein
MPATGRFLLVELAEDLAAHYTTLTGVRACLRIIPGVVAVTDMAAISADTLTDILLPADQSWRTIPKKRGAKR